jgi:ankyrin repeat protein
MVSYGANVDAVDNYGLTPLHRAAVGEKDCPELCEILLKHKAKIDAVDKDGYQPLHWACQKGHSETVKLMVSHGANVDVVNMELM